MKLFKPSLAILMVVSVLSDLIPAETSASITTHSQQYISAIQYISQYPNNWRMSQTDLFNTDTGFLVEVKTLWKQISKIPDSIQRAASYRTSLRDTIKRKTFDRLLLSKEASLFDLHRTQPWNIYKQRVSESLESIMARSNFIAKDILKFLFRLQENIKQMETLHINSDASSAFEDVCIVLEKAGYHYRSCYPQIEVLHTRHETVNISTTYVDIEGVRKNEVNQWSEIRKDPHENCTLTLKTGTTPLKLSIGANRDGTLHLRYYTKNKIGRHCEDGDSRDVDTTSFSERLAEKNRLVHCIDGCFSRCSQQDFTKQSC